MNMRALVPFGAPVLLMGLAVPVRAQETAGALEARVWLDRGDEPVLHEGENVRVYYRTSEDAFAAIFRIDTDGRVHLVYPQHPEAIDVVRARRDYRLLFPHAPTWQVREDPGVGYFFIVASPEPLDFSTFPYDEVHGWDLSFVGDVVYSDPYVAIDDYVARVVPDWEQVPYALDFVTYSVGATYSYPRFLCYDCHTYQRYTAWNPYDYTCSTFRVVIWDDPYFYPRYRYSGVNVVVAPRPVRAALPRYEVTRRALGDAVAPVVRTRAPTARQAVEYKEPGKAVPASVISGTARPRSAVLSAPASVAVPTQEKPGGTPQEASDTARARPTLQRRPSSRLPVRTPPSREPEQPEPAPTPARAAPSRLPVRAPATRPNSAPAEPNERPATSRPTAPSSSTRQPRSAPSAPARTPSVRAAPGSTGRSASPPPSRPPARAVPAPGSSSGGASRPQAAPRANGGTSGGAARPSTSPPARAAAPPRSAEPRPTVRPRPADAR
ncbi:MAG: DUF4384 domain-containing protein [Gemmatimonadales bacterium]